MIKTTPHITVSDVMYKKYEMLVETDERKSVECFVGRAKFQTKQIQF